MSVGHLIKFLRDGSGLGQALAYIRPLQNLKMYMLKKQVFQR